MVRRHDNMFARDFLDIERLSSKANLAAVTAVAEDRKKWQKLVERICKAAEAEMRL